MQKVEMMRNFVMLKKVEEYNPGWKAVFESASRDYVVFFQVRNDAGEGDLIIYGKDECTPQHKRISFRNFTGLNYE